jgi:pimeloyl-ACP methyl ester carboxylesterase
VLLMLPGGTYRPDNYFQLIEDLADDHRVLAPVYPPVHPLPLVVAGLLAVLDDAGVPAATICGWSYGGYVAQVFAKEEPGRTRHLVLAQTGTRHIFGLTTMRIFATVFARLPLNMKQGFTRRLWRRWFTSPASSREFWNGRLEEELQQISDAQHTAGVANMIDFMAHYSPAPGWLAPWQGRVLILQSASDGAFKGDRQAELRAAYPEAAVRTIPGGHTALFTHPGWFTAQIRDFLAA